MSPYYRTSPTDRGESYTVTSGGHYERVVDGVPQVESALGDYVGFQTSNIAEVCASYSPEASLFAAIKGGDPGKYYIYETDSAPDVDISETTVGDFACLEEVRYRCPEETPVTFTRSYCLSVPERAITDVNLAYLPSGPYIIPTWADAVKDALRILLDNGEYPLDVGESTSVSRPDREAWETNPYL